MKNKIVQYGRVVVGLLLIFAMLCCMAACGDEKSPNAIKKTDYLAQGEIDAINGEMKWTLDAAGTLTVSGTGDMPDYAYLATPWFSVSPLVTKIVVEEGVTGIGRFAFSLCEQAESISLPSTLRTIGTFAIRDCIGLKSITIPAGVVEIGDYFLVGDVSLEKIEVEYGNKYYRSQNNCLIDNEGVILAGCKNSTIPTEGVWAIGAYSFCNVWEMTQLTIPDNITEIRRYAFGDTGLTSVVLPQAVTVVPAYVFSKCSHLASVTLSDLTTEIGDQAFSGCDSLATISIPGSVTKIGKEAFFSALNLTDVYFGGTMADWQTACADADAWNVRSESLTIHCTDGDVNVQVYKNTQTSSGS